MPIFNIDSFKSGTTPAKAIFSACLAIYLYAGDLGTLLDQELEIFLLLTSLIFFIFSIFKAVEWMIQLGIFIIIDRKNQKNSFTLWETLNQPQWEDLLLDSISDIYLIGGFILIFFRIETFVERLTQIIWITLPNYIPQIAVTILILAVSTRLGYRVYTKKRIITLCMQFLTLVKHGGVYPKDLETHLVNRSWPLFEKQLSDHYVKYIHLYKDLERRLSNLLNEEPENNNWFSAVGGEMKNLHMHLSNPKIFELNFLISYSFYPTLTDLISKYKIIQYIHRELSKQSVSYSVIGAFIAPKPEWKRIGKGQRGQIIEIIDNIAENNHLEYKITENWVKSYYNELKQLITTLNRFNSKLEAFIGNK